MISQSALSQELVLTLLSPHVQRKVKEQFQKGTEIVPVENFDMSFRLFKTSPQNINLELLSMTDLEEGGEEDFGSWGRVKTQRRVTYFKPIGFYTLRKTWLSADLDITILKEFEDALDNLNRAGKIPDVGKIKRLSLKENAVIAAFSMEAFARAYQYRDASFYANGLKMDIYMSFEGFPQSFLDDSYGMEGPIGAYVLKGANQSINPMVYNKNLFDRFYEQGLLSAFKYL